MAQGNGKPTHIVRARTGRKNDGGDDILYTFGVAWKHRNGDGFNIQLHSVPIGFDGYLMVIEQRDRD